MDAVRRTPPVLSARVANPAASPPAAPQEPLPSPADAHAPGPAPAPPSLDVRQELQDCIFKPWARPSGALQALCAVQAPTDEKALATLRGVERRGLWGEEDNAARQDLGLLRFHLPAGADFEDAAAGYDALFAIEAKQHSDPTPHARRAVEVVAPRLRPGESMRTAAEAYGELYRFEAGRDIDPSSHARDAYLRVDAAMLPCQDRKTAVFEYCRNPDTFASRQAAAKVRFEERQAELKRVAETVAQGPRADARIEQADEWIIVAGVRVPRRAEHPFSADR